MQECSCSPWFIIWIITNVLVSCTFHKYTFKEVHSLSLKGNSLNNQWSPSFDLFIHATRDVHHHFVVHVVFIKLCRLIVRATSGPIRTAVVWSLLNWHPKLNQPHFRDKQQKSSGNGAESFGSDKSNSQDWHVTRFMFLYRPQLDHGFARSLGSHLKMPILCYLDWENWKP